jgi:hypothetical protein
MLGIILDKRNQAVNKIYIIQLLGSLQWRQEQHIVKEN